MELVLPGEADQEQEEVLVEGAWVPAGWEEHAPALDLLEIVFAPLAEPGLLIRWQAPAIA